MSFDCDPDDISDAVMEVGRSFGISYMRDTFLKVTTFGELCDVIVAAIGRKHRDGCTSQQAFYRLRDAILQVTGFDGSTIAPSTSLDVLFPRKGRRRKMRELQRLLGVELGLLDLKESVGGALVLGYLLSFVYVFFNWQYGVVGFLGCMMFNWVAWRLASELTCETVGDAVRLFVRTHYRLARRDAETVNRDEVIPVIKDVFAHSLALDPGVMTPDAKLL